MTRRFAFQENGLHIVLEVPDEGEARVLHFSAAPFDSPYEEKWASYYRLVEVQASGDRKRAMHGSRQTGSMPGGRLRYVRHSDTRAAQGRRMAIEQQDPLTGLSVITHWQFFDGVPVIRAWTELINNGAKPIGLEYVSSFALAGVAKEGVQPWTERMCLHVPHNTWCGEFQWRAYRLPELGLEPYHTFTSKRLAYGSQGSWSTSHYLPMGWLENEETGSNLFWQIEHNGSWHWELGLVECGQMYVLLSGPTENESHWWKSLARGESFISVPVAVGSVMSGVSGGLEPAMSALTRYRRLLRRPHKDNERLPVIFNDYMNCLGADPTTAKELPLIAVAAEVGCEYYVVDAGWYGDGSWWDSVGEWLPSKRRFPGGLGEVLDAIRAKGMIPGLWLELEVMGINCPLAAQLPDDWFFCRHGRRVIDGDRYQLDFHNPDVIKHADAIIDRLVKEYGVGYIKMDYNINIGIGTERNADSFGDGLLQHNRACLAWLESVFARYPELVIENCGSGGQRMDYAQLRLHSIQSSSDQTDYRKYAVIAAAAPTGVTPEQCAVWSYPLERGDREETIFNMINAMLLRIHQSGSLNKLDRERLALVQEGLACYKTFRSEIPRSLPIWPLGLPSLASPWTSMGLTCGGRTCLAVWRLNTPDETCVLALPALRGKAVRVECIYPHEACCRWQWQASAGRLSVSLPQPFSARLFRLECS